MKGHTITWPNPLFPLINLNVVFQINSVDLILSTQFKRHLVVNSKCCDRPIQFRTSDVHITCLPDLHTHVHLHTKFSCHLTVEKIFAELHLCLSVGACNVQLGAACHVLTPQQLWLIVDHLERHIYQLAASYGVQWRRLSRHSTTKFA